MARACSERWVSFFGDRRSSSFSNANDSALDSNRTGLPAGTSSSCQMRLASGRMPCRSRLRTGVASGPSDEQIVQQDDGRGQCLTRLVFRSNVMLADAISRPSTSAANVPIRPVVILTTSRESRCRCCSDNKGRTTAPSRAPPNIKANARNETNRSFMVDISPPCRWLTNAGSVYRADRLKAPRSFTTTTARSMPMMFFSATRLFPYMNKRLLGPAEMFARR
jgi:hypothetical protein